MADLTQSKWFTFESIAPRQCTMATIVYLSIWTMPDGIVCLLDLRWLISLDWIALGHIIWSSDGSNDGLSEGIKCYQTPSETIRTLSGAIRHYQTLSTRRNQTPSNIVRHYHLDSNHKRKRKLIQSSVLSDFHLPVQFLLLVFINRLFSKKFLHTFVWRFHHLSLSSNRRTRSLD